MNLKKIIHVIILLIAVEIVYSEITTEIYLNKSEYLEAEPIIFTIKFKNNSNSLDSIEMSSVDEYVSYIIFQSVEKKEMHYNYMTSDRIGGPLYLKFLPEQEIFKVSDLSNKVGNIKLKYSCMAGEYI
jgi:hypothetical protein